MPSLREPLNLPHADFVSGYRDGLIACHIDPSLALNASISQLVPRNYRVTHQIFNTAGGCLIPLFAVASFFFWPWWIGLLILAINFMIVIPGLKRGACENMLALSLENPSVYEIMTASGTLVVTLANEGTSNSQP